MIYLWVLAFCVLLGRRGGEGGGGSTATLIRQDERVNGENGWYVPQVDGTFEWVDKEEAEKYLEIAAKKEGPLIVNPVKFYLHTISNPDNAQEITADANSIQASYFNASHPTRITIHGWTSDKDDYVNWGVRNAWFSHGDYNMIAIEWARARSIDYVSSVLAVPGVGEIIAELVEYLVKNFGLKLENLEIIGHSLGAHVAGFTGKNIKSGKVHVIMGLDPALPFYSYSEPSKRLADTDAHYVESIQTNCAFLGFLKPIGKGSFYPNGGRTQPGCGLDVASICSHLRAVTYYVEAIELDNFSSIECDNYLDAFGNNCDSNHSSVRMGAAINAYMVSGIYYVPVKSQAPYGIVA